MCALPVPRVTRRGASAQLEIWFNNAWLEVLGCGVMRERILQNGGLREHTGWAFGLGLERLAMVRACACACVRVRACVRACACSCSCACARVCARGLGPRS